MVEEGFRLGPQCDMQVEGASWGGGAHGQLWPPQVVGNCRKLGAPKVFYILRTWSPLRCQSAWCSLRWTRGAGPGVWNLA